MKNFPIDSRNLQKTIWFLGNLNIDNFLKKTFLLFILLINDFITLNGSQMKLMKHR